MWYVTLSSLIVSREYKKSMLPSKCIFQCLQDTNLVYSILCRTYRVLSQQTLYSHCGSTELPRGWAESCNEDPASLGTWVLCQGNSVTSPMWRPTGQSEEKARLACHSERHFPSSCPASPLLSPWQWDVRSWVLQWNIFQLLDIFGVLFTVMSHHFWPEGRHMQILFHFLMVWVTWQITAGGKFCIDTLQKEFSSHCTKI